MLRTLSLKIPKSTSFTTRIKPNNLKPLRFFCSETPPSLPTDRFYTETHEWIKLDNDIYRIGLTYHAQSELGDVVYITLPKQDTEFKKDEPMLNIESVKTTADINAPFDCIVTGVNIDLDNKTSLINESPYDEGWLVEVRAKEAEELVEFMDSDKYRELLDNI